MNEQILTELLNDNNFEEIKHFLKKTVININYVDNQGTFLFKTDSIDVMSLLLQEHINVDAIFKNKTILIKCVEEGILKTFNFDKIALLLKYNPNKNIGDWSFIYAYLNRLQNPNINLKQFIFECVKNNVLDIKKIKNYGLLLYCDLEFDNLELDNLYKKNSIYV